MVLTNMFNLPLLVLVLRTNTQRGGIYDITIKGKLSHLELPSDNLKIITAIKQWGKHIREDAFLIFSISLVNLTKYSYE